MKKVVLIALALLMVLPLFSYEKDEIRVITENLRLRADSNTSSDVVTTLQAQSLVQVQEVGSEATIDGIKANWIKVKTLISAKTRDGDLITESLEGWCFGGYTSLYADYYYAPTLFLRARNGDIVKSEVSGELPIKEHADSRYPYQAVSSLEKQEMEDGAVLYVQRDKLYEQILWQTTQVYPEYSRAYLEVDGNLYLIAIETSGLGFSDYSCQKTRNGYLIKKQNYSSFGKSDGGYGSNYFYVSQKNGSWYIKNFYWYQSEVEWSGEEVTYVASEEGDDFLFQTDNFTDYTVYTLTPGTPVASKGIIVRSSLYVEPDAESEILKDCSNGQYALLLESGKTFVEYDTVEFHPFYLGQLSGDWEMQWVKVQILGTDLIGWAKIVLRPM